MVHLELAWVRFEAIVGAAHVAHTESGDHDDRDPALPRLEQMDHALVDGEHPRIGLCRLLIFLLQPVSPPLIGIKRAYDKRWKSMLS